VQQQGTYDMYDAKSRRVGLNVWGKPAKDFAEYFK
jgi:hypothetical protein